MSFGRLLGNSQAKVRIVKCSSHLFEKHHTFAVKALGDVGNVADVYVCADGGTGYANMNVVDFERTADLGCNSETFIN